MTLGLKPRGSCVVDWKSTVVWDLLAVLLFDVLADHLVGDCPGADRQVSSRPEMPSPELLLQMRKLLQQYARADPFHGRVRIRVCRQTKDGPLTLFSFQPDIDCTVYVRELTRHALR